jgi:amino acid synthesis protein
VTVCDKGSGVVENTEEDEMVEIRKIITTREVVLSELGVAAPRPVLRAVGLAVIRNSFAGRFVDDLQPLFEAGAMLGERLMPELVKLLDGPAVSYGKGAIVGVNGEMEHGGACVHPMLGKPMRAAIGGGKAVISSNVKVAAAGASLDVPLGHKDDTWSIPSFRYDNGVGRRRTPPGRNPRRDGHCRRRRLRNRCGIEPIR